MPRLGRHLGYGEKDEGTPDVTRENKMTDGQSNKGPRKPVVLKAKTDPPSRRSVLLAGTALAAKALSSSSIV
jgi:hypothetical protein